MTRFTCLVLGLFVFASCEDFSLLEKDQNNIFFSENIVTSGTYDSNLSIATFNMKLGFCQNCDPFSGNLGGDYEQLDKIVHLINEMNLDIVALQEVGYRYDTSIIENQIQYIAERTQMNYAYGMGRALQTGNNLFLRGFIGNGILSKYEIVQVENPTIRYIDYYNQNHALKVRIELNDEKEIVVLTPHLESGSTDNEKTSQINEILTHIKNETVPIIIAGDFNISYTTNNPFLSLLSDSNFLNSLEDINSSELSLILDTGTFITGSTIDYIFTSEGDFNVESASVSPMEFRDISDHYLYRVVLN